MGKTWLFSSDFINAPKMLTVMNAKQVSLRFISLPDPLLSATLSSTVLQ